jgi:phage terminase large subunit GpA-like protein
VYRNYLRGDQNKLFLPCPHCGEFQELVLKSSVIDYGLTFSREKDKRSGHKVLVPETVRYICQHCGKPIYESKKQWMLERFEWRAHNVAANDKVRSFHVSGISAPTIMLTWERLIRDFIDTAGPTGDEFGSDILKMKDFYINDLGWPWAGVQKQADWQKVKDKAEEYTLGEVPVGHVVKVDDREMYKGPLALFAGCDVQGDRLELQVVAFGPDMELWQIDYQVFFGNPARLSDQCWRSLHDWVYTHGYEICGKKRTIGRCAVDAGYNNKKLERVKDFADKARVVYNFVGRRQDRFIAVKGQGDEKGPVLLAESRVNDPGCQLKKFYNLYVSSIKEIIMNRIEQTEGFGTLHFPKYMKDAAGNKILRPDEHWKRLMSERYQELEPKKYGWKKIHMRNEDWDTLIYAYAAAEFHSVSAWSTGQWRDRWLSLVG